MNRLKSLRYRISFVYLKLNSSNETDLIEIKNFDITGKNVYVNKRLANQKFEINLLPFDPGLYFVNVTQGYKNQVVKLIKE